MKQPTILDFALIYAATMLLCELIDHFLSKY